MILKTISAGPFVQQVLYDNIVIRKGEPPEEKREKTAIRRGMKSICSNRQYAIAALIFQNFTSQSLFCTLTFSPDYTPINRKETASRFSYFRKKLQNRGYDIRYLKCMEHKTSGGLFHIHAIIDGAPREEILSCWIYNGEEHCCVEPLELRRVVPYIKRDGTASKGLASYITKEKPDKVGQRQIQCSQRRNKLEYPVITREKVPDNHPLTHPEGAELLEQVRTVFNQYGQVWYCRYLTPF